MGINLFGSSDCRCREKPVACAPFPKPPLPDPRRYKLEAYWAVGDWLVAMVHYPDATNFEGRKVLVFQGVTVEKLKSLDFLDPHFCDAAHISPFARFVPTKAGWEAACAFARQMAKDAQR